MSKNAKTLLIIGVVAAAGAGAWYYYNKRKNMVAPSTSNSGGTAVTKTVEANKPVNTSETAQVITASTDALGKLSDIIARNFGSN